MAIACLALFVALSGVAYAAATIGSDDIVDGSIRNRDFKDGTLRGNEAKRERLRRRRDQGALAAPRASSAR